MSLNRVTLVGRIGKDPQIHELNNNSKVVSFSIQTLEYFTNAQGVQQEISDWHRVSVYIPTWIDYTMRYVKSGDKVMVNAQVTTSSRKGANGQTFTKIGFNVQEITLLEKKNNGFSNQQTNSQTQGNGNGYNNQQPNRQTQGYSNGYNNQQPNRQTQGYSNGHNNQQPNRQTQGYNNGHNNQQPNRQTQGYNNGHNNQQPNRQTQGNGNGHNNQQPNRPRAFPQSGSSLANDGYPKILDPNCV